MSKEITTLFEAQQRINDLERKLKSKKSKLSELDRDNKELKEVLRGWLNCNYSESENIQRSKEILMNGELTNNTNK